MSKKNSAKSDSEPKKEEFGDWDENSQKNKSDSDNESESDSEHESQNKPDKPDKVNSKDKDSDKGSSSKDKKDASDASDDDNEKESSSKKDKSSSKKSSKKDKSSSKKSSSKKDKSSKKSSKKDKSSSKKSSKKESAKKSSTKKEKDTSKSGKKSSSKKDKTSSKKKADSSEKKEKKRAREDQPLLAEKSGINLSLARVKRVLCHKLNAGIDAAIAELKGIVESKHGNDESKISSETKALIEECKAKYRERMKEKFAREKLVAWKRDDRKRFDEYTKKKNDAKKAFLENKANADKSFDYAAFNEKFDKKFYDGFKPEFFKRGNINMTGGKKGAVQKDSAGKDKKSKSSKESSKESSKDSDKKKKEPDTVCDLHIALLSKYKIRLSSNAKVVVTSFLEYFGRQLATNAILNCVMDGSKGRVNVSVRHLLDASLGNYKVRAGLLDLMFSTNTYRRYVNEVVKHPEFDDKEQENEYLSKFFESLRSNDKSSQESGKDSSSKDKKHKSGKDKKSKDSDKDKDKDKDKDSSKKSKVNKSSRETNFNIYIKHLFMYVRKHMSPHHDHLGVKVDSERRDKFAETNITDRIKVFISSIMVEVLEKLALMFLVEIGNKRIRTITEDLVNVSIGHIAILNNVDSADATKRITHIAEKYQKYNTSRKEELKKAAAKKEKDSS